MTLLQNDKEIEQNVKMPSDQYKRRKGLFCVEYCMNSTVSIVSELLDHRKPRQLIELNNNKFTILES